jgi:hypothetical protein
MRVLGIVVIALIVAACGGAGPSGGTAVAPATAEASPSIGEAVASANAGDTMPIVGEWVRTATCEEALAAFVEAGLDDQVQDWVVGNYVAEGAEAPGDACADAKPAVPHSHFFTKDGQFGSRDEHGRQVDDGDYEVVDADTLSFPSATRDFGSDQDVLVDYAIEGDEVRFVVTVPASCDGGCRVAYGWAMSAFFGPHPFERT